MKIRRFEGSNTQEALLLAQQALGADAVILQTRRVKAPGINGLLGTSRVEVLAAVDPAAAPRAALASRPRAVPVPTPRNSVEQDLLAVRLEIAQLKGELAERSAESPVARVTPEPRWAVGGDLRSRVNRLNTRTIDMQEGRCTTVAFIGPTGVGKTTTLAKLAAVASHVERKRVALITVDTYRIAAVEQLETYSRLLSVPMTVARTAEEVVAARAAYSGFDLLLIDTIGRSPRAVGSIAELAELLAAAHPDERHLLLDAGASGAATRCALDGFRSLVPTHVALGKLDQTSRIDDALAAALDAGLPFSYLTTGQSVPEDLAAANAEELRPWLQGAPA